MISSEENEGGCGKLVGWLYCTEDRLRMPVLDYCGKPSCSRCYNVKARKQRVAFQRLVDRLGQPYAFITLTLGVREDLSEAISEIHEAKRRLTNYKIWKEAYDGWVWRLEIVDKGDWWHTHLHIVTWGGWCEFDELREKLQVAGFGKIFDIRRVWRNQGKTVCGYLTKEMSKFIEVYRTEEYDLVMKNRHLWGSGGKCRQNLDEIYKELAAEGCADGRKCPKCGKPMIFTDPEFVNEDRTGPPESWVYNFCDIGEFEVWSNGN